MRWTFLALCALALAGCSSTETNDLTFAVTVVSGGAGSGTITSTPAGIDCGSTCSASFKSETSLTLTATPAAGSVFAGWGGACSGASLTCTVTVTRALAVEAAFEPESSSTAKLTVVLAGDGAGSISTGATGLACTKTVSGTNTTCSRQVPVGTPITVSAASTESTIAFEGCDSVSGDTCTVTLQDDRTVTVTFTLPTNTLTVTRDGTGSGTVTSAPAGIDCGSTCSASFAGEPSVTLTAEADTGSSFTGWSGACSGTSPTCTVTLDQALSVNATFDAIPAGPVLTINRTGGPVTVTSSPAGIDCQADAGGAQTCSASFTQGEVVTLTAIGEWGLPSFTGCTPVEGSDLTCTVTMDADATVDVGAPAAPSYAVDFDGGGAGSVASSLASLSCDSASGGCASGGVHSSDYPITLTAAAASGSIFGSWSGCPSASGATCTIGSAGGGDPLLTVTAVFHKAVTGLAAADVGREGAQLTWDAMPSDGYFTGVQVSHRVTGDTTWTSTSAPATNSYTLTGLTPGTQYDARVTVSFGDGTSSEATLTFTTPAAVSGSALDWNENQTTPTAAGGKLAVSWDATTLYFGLTNSAGQPVLVNPGDTVWLALDTDPATDASGSSSIASTIFPFRADKIVQVSLVDAAGTIFAQVQDGSGGFSTPASFASAVGAYDAFQIAKAEVGDPTRVRLAATVYDATGLISTDLAPVNPNATDVWGVHTSLTSSLDSNGGLWNPATGLASMSTLTSSEAPNLVAITVHQPDGVTGTLKVRGDVLPLDWFVENTHYALADDGNHGDGAAADGTWGGRFNFDGATRELFFKFMDDATYAGTCDTAPCPEPTFNNDGTERVWTLSGTAETLPTLEWNTVYDASHAFSLVLEVATGGSPTEVIGGISELGSWTCGSGAALADTGTQDNGNEVWTATIFPANYDFVTTPLAFKTIYGCGNYEGGGDHVLNDDVINARILRWTAGVDQSF